MKKFIKQIVQEPLEILQNAREQIAPVNVPTSEKQVDDEQKIERNQNELVDKTKSSRRIEALDRELKDIERDRIFKEIQRKISEGQEVYLEEYPELSMEQKQVLNAQVEAVKQQMLNAKNANAKSLTEPVAKKGRKLFNFGKKTAMKREQTHVEKPVPPSG
ncbi:MAG: hypothetical protein AAB535_01045 [Patescibacteria group bacterium]|mgnify:CR=1 FL=1